MTSSTERLDRAAGALLGTAVGDALGAGYEFGSAVVGAAGPQMIGGGLGGFAPGEWTDDTTMTWCVADVLAAGGDLRTSEGLTAVATRFRTWYESHPPDIGAQTARVLHDAGPRPTGAQLAAAAAALHERTGRTAGNGSLMRTAPVALAHLGDEAATADAARAVSALTHADPRAGEACVLWSLAVGHAVLTAQLDVGRGLGRLDADGRDYWTARLDEAEGSEPGRFTPNGWVVTALQAAWSAIVHTPGHGLADTLATAIRIGDDTDTVAAIAGGLVGAARGASTVPEPWRQIVHGYPGLRGDDLVDLARRIVG